MVANGKVYVGSLSRFVTVFGLTSSGPVPQNLALNATATSSAPCSSSQAAAQAVDGNFSTNWCSTASNPWLMVDLGAPYNVARFVVEHAGAGGESFDNNTAAFNIQVSNDGVNFTTVVNVSGNVDSITTHDISPTTARFIQLNITTPTQTSSTTASVYEFQVFAALPAPSADFTFASPTDSSIGYAGTSSTFSTTSIALNGFAGNIALGATGLPAGASVSYDPPSLTASGSSIATVATSCSTPPGTYTVVLTATSGSLQHTINTSITVNPVTNMCGAYNRVGLVNDGTTFPVVV